MAESSLSIGLTELRQEVGFYLGMGRGVSKAWTAAQILEIDSAVQSGVRNVYFPPAISAEIAGHEWSWLNPTTTLTTVVDDYDYDLPDDFGRITSPLYYPINEYRDSIPITSIGKILGARSFSDDSGYPTCAATRFKASTGATGQRQELLMYPKPNAIWVFSYTYEAYTGALTASFPYPLGGMKYSELYIESCLAIAEGRFHDEPHGEHNQAFERRLVDMIRRDGKGGAQIFGQMGQKIAEDPRDFRRGMTGGTYPITYKGELI